MNNLATSPGSLNCASRVGLQQRVLAAFRRPLMEELAVRCAGGLSVFAGIPRPEENIEVAQDLQKAKFIRGCNVHVLHEPLYTCWQIGLMRWLRDWNPDVLIVEANPRCVLTRLARAWMHARKRPVIGWGLGTMSLSTGFETVRAIVRKHFVSYFDAVIAYSSRAAEEYAALGVPVDRIFIAYNAITPRPNVPPPQRSERVEYPVKVLFVGRMVSGKRVENLVHACAALPKNIQPDLLLVGDGPTRRSAEQIARVAYPRARFFGAKYGSELDQIFSEADLLVLPGLGGLAIQQAMAHALPVIAAEGDGTQNDLITPENGWNIVPGNIAALTEALRVALAEPDQLRAMGRASFRIVAERINIEAMADAFVHAIRSVAH